LVVKTHDVEALTIQCKIGVMTEEARARRLWREERGQARLKSPKTAKGKQQKATADLLNTLLKPPLKLLLFALQTSHRKHQVFWKGKKQTAKSKRQSWINSIRC